MLLTCESCSHLLKAPDLDRLKGIATCPRCGALMRLDLPGLSNSSPLIAPRAPRPERFEVEEGSDLLIRWKNSRWLGFFLIFFSVFWDGVLSVFVVVGFTEDGAAVMLPFLSLHLLVGLALPYFALVNLLNHTELRCGNGQLSVRHRPLWWFGQKTLETSELEQFYVAERQVQNKNSVSLRYELMAVRNDQIAVSVVNGLATQEEGKFLEQSLEERLGIRNRPVTGEA